MRRFLALIAALWLAASPAFAQFDGAPDTRPHSAMALGYRGAPVVLLEQHSANNTSSELDFTNWYSPAYSVYQIEIVNLTPATTNNDLTIEFSTNGGSSYDQTNGHYEYGMSRFGAIDGGGHTGAASGLGGLPVTGGFVAVSNSTSLGGVSGSLKLYSPGSSSMNKRIYGEVNYSITTGSNSVDIFIVTATYLQTTAVNAFRIRSATSPGGNLMSGSARVYGLAP